MKKIALLIVLVFGCQFVFAQELEGRWVNLSFTGDENAAYEFKEGNIMKMYFGGKEIPTAVPVEYDLTEEDEYFLITTSFYNKMNGRKENLIGKLEFLSEDQFKLEFWQKGKVPKGYEFTENAMTYTKSE